MLTSQRNWQPKQQPYTCALSEEAAKAVRAAACRWGCSLEEAVLILLGLRPPPAPTM